MKGDFSRYTFNPRGHYTRVALQQGRVLVDADWNEQAEIALHDQRLTRRAVIGPSGGPFERAALRLAIGLFEPNEPAIGVGGATLEPLAADSPFYAKPAQYWVEGCTLTQERAWRLKQQPHLEEDLPTDAGYYLAWVDVFEHLLLALDVPEIREQALGGPDHGTRVRQIWQVKLHRFDFAGAPPEQPDCFDVPPAWRPPEPTGRMHARVADPAQSADPCVVPMAAGYRRLENQLYRIEVCKAGDEQSAEFVWSRDNGTVRVGIVDDSYVEGESPTLRVAELGRDELSRLSPDDWIEITDEARTLRGEFGFLCRIANVLGTTLELGDGAPTRAQFEELESPTARRWDAVDPSKHVGASYLDHVAYPVRFGLDANYFDLEDGVQIRFGAGTYRVGDYWLVPARTASADVEFAGGPQPPHGVQHYAAALGILHCDGAGVWTLVRDCRNLFPPLTRLTQLHYIGGDGQESVPGALLPAPLEVAVCDGSTPLEGVEIRFHVEVPDGAPATQPRREALGYLLPATATAPNSGAGSFTRSAWTGPDGIARVRWVLGAHDLRSNAGYSQHVTAKVERHGPGDPQGEIHFSATQSIAREVSIDITACPANEEAPNPRALRTVQALMGAAGIDPSNPQHQNVQHVLHQLLCRLHAGHVPYAFPQTPVEIERASVVEVKSALDALYWLVLQRQGCCCLSDVLKRLADLVGGRAGGDLCKALQLGPIEGDCSILEITLGSALHLVRVLHAVVLAFLDLQDAPGQGRGFADLKLGDETGIELDAFIYGEGPGWFATRIEERIEQVDALGDRLGDVFRVVLERVFTARGVAAAIRELAERFGQPDVTWNGPATRLFILERIWEPLFGTRRLDDRVLLILRDLLFEIARALWIELVELLLCGEPIESRSPISEWFGAIEDNLGRALDRALSLHGLVRELPEERWGTARDVHMVAPSDSYPSGATWVVAATEEEESNGVQLLRWRHDEGANVGPIPALEPALLRENVTLPEPNLVLTTPRDRSVRLLDSGARRQSLHALIELVVQEQTRSVLWYLPSAEVSGLEGRIEVPFAGIRPRIGVGFTHSVMDAGHNVLVRGGPDDPPTLTGWARDSDDELMYLWPPTERGQQPYLITEPVLRKVGLTGALPLSAHAFALDAGRGKPGRFVGVALTRFDAFSGRLLQRNVLLLLSGRDTEGPAIPWWRGEFVVPEAAVDFAPGVRVIGGAHDLIALQDDGSNSEPELPGSGRVRWALVHVDELLEGAQAFPRVSRHWDNGLVSTVILVPDDRWHDGDILSVVHGSDALWVQVLGPLSGRVGMYGAWSEAIPALRRQMVRGAAVGDSETAFQQVKDFFEGDEGEGEGEDEGQTAEPETRLAHDYLLERASVGERPGRLLTVCLRSGNGVPRIEFNASPRS